MTDNSFAEKLFMISNLDDSETTIYMNTSGEMVFRQKKKHGIESTLFIISERDWGIIKKFVDKKFLAIKPPKPKRESKKTFVERVISKADPKNN